MGVRSRRHTKDFPVELSVLLFEEQPSNGDGAVWALGSHSRRRFARCPTATKAGQMQSSEVTLIP
jgi:hypothetical protein